MEVVEMFLVLEENQFFEGLEKRGRGQFRPEQEIENLIARRPEQQGQQKPGNAAGIELFQGQGLFRGQQKGPAGHQEERHAGPADGSPEERGQPVAGTGQGHRQRRRGDVYENDPPNRQSLH